ncbi:YesL family protein [Agromyces sp. ISL-38]|uniref:YesL family protein n=1 Tax=Agromyces sp. ISL-38 TaxID=2819107 RepID=UPI001BE860EB|nr:YesL family protein [Agromyces sp. ISL-38]MBT2499700.1 YesL family protein [Agromyces sp. ISL-38]MBT2516152.1 YesL family protein [Streptomyces sp. ISL-90]
MRIDPNSRSVQGLSTFIEFVALNLMYLVSCVPIVTIGAATSALFEVTIRYSDDETGRPVADFFPAFMRNFRRGALTALALLGPVALLAFSAVFWLSTPTSLGTAAGVIAALAAVYLFAAFLYAMALVATFDDGIRRTLKNALLLAAAEPVRTFGLLMIPVALVCISVLFPPFLVIMGTIGFSVAAYAAAFLFRSAFARHRP